LEPTTRPFENLPFTVDPEMLAFSRRAIKETRASNGLAVLQYPHALVRDDNEAKILKENKVKLIRSKNFLHKYDERGLMIHEEYYEDTDFGIRRRQKGLKAITRRNTYGYEVTKEVIMNGDVWSSKYYYSGDTVFIAKFIKSKAAPAVPDVMYVTYGNIDVIYDCERRDFDLIYYKVTSSNDDYLIECLRDYLKEGDKTTELEHTLRLTKDFRLKEESLDGIQHRYTYDSLGLLMNVESYNGNKPFRKISYSRNERGLVTEYSSVEFRRKGKVKSSDTVRYEYGYYD
jgi:YD repeat-containing protein